MAPKKAAEKELKKAPKKAAKKAAKHVGKKAAKKHADHKGEKHFGGKDLRRAYEHLGRLDALRPNLSGAVVAQINLLIELARISLGVHEAKAAAELLRACEHLAFAAMTKSAAEKGVGEALQAAIREQYEHLLEKAADRWDEHEDEPSRGITSIYEDTLAAAEKAFDKGAFHKALELVRAADALAHAGHVGSLMLASGQVDSKALKS